MIIDHDIANIKQLLKQKEKGMLVELLNEVGMSQSEVDDVCEELGEPFLNPQRYPQLAGQHQEVDTTYIETEADNTKPVASITIGKGTLLPPLAIPHHILRRNEAATGIGNKQDI